MADSSGQGGGEVQSQWVRVRTKLRAEYGDAAYRSWLRNMSLQGIEDGRAKIAVPTRFLRDWVAAHYADRIRALWNSENSGVVAVDILVSGGTAVMATPEPATAVIDAAEVASDEKVVDEKD